MRLFAKLTRARMVMKLLLGTSETPHAAEVTREPNKELNKRCNLGLLYYTEMRFF